MNSRASRVFKLIIGFSISVYVILILYETFSVFTYAFLTFRFGLWEKFFPKLGSTSISLFQACIVLFTLIFASKAYALWLKQDIEYKVLLKKTAQGLIGIALIDGLYLIYNLTFLIRYAPSSKDLFKADDLLTTMIKFVYENTESIHVLTKYFVPRPSGVFAALLGFLILNLLKNSEPSKLP